MTDDGERAPEKRFLLALDADVWKAIEELREKHHALRPDGLKPSAEHVIGLAIVAMHEDGERAPEMRPLPPLDADMWKKIDELRDAQQAWRPGGLKPSAEDVIGQAISAMHEKEFPDKV